VLLAALARFDGPTIVVLNAADLNIGACDPFVELIAIAHAADAWVHIDGAIGLWVKASPTRRRLVEGVEGADSWATDAHKWLNTPKDCGLAFVRDAAAHRAAMAVSASYIAADGDARDQLDWTPDFSRRARGFAVYAALRELGRRGVGQLIDRCCEHAAALARGIAALPGAELVSAPTLNQGLVRFLDGRPGAGEADHDRATDAVIAAINDGGEAFFSGTTWRGRRAMRISVCNWRTDSADVSRSVSAIEAVLATRSLPV
jgi:aromatic-L-amino-acid decarboxylase